MRKSEEELIDQFGKIVEKMLKENDIKMLIELPAGSMTATVKSNVNTAAIDFYILLHALQAVMEQLCKEADVDPEKKPQMIDGMLQMVKDSMLEED